MNLKKAKQQSDSQKGVRQPIRGLRPPNGQYDYKIKKCFSGSDEIMDTYMAKTFRRLFQLVTTLEVGLLDILLGVPIYGGVNN